MAGIIAGTAEIGYLIMFESGTAQTVIHTGKHGGTDLIGLGCYAAGGTKTVQGGVLLIRETV